MRLVGDPSVTEQTGAGVSQVVDAQPVEAEMVGLHLNGPKDVPATRRRAASRLKDERVGLDQVEAAPSLPVAMRRSSTASGSGITTVLDEERVLGSVERPRVPTKLPGDVDLGLREVEVGPGQAESLGDAKPRERAHRRDRAELVGERPEQAVEFGAGEVDRLVPPLRRGELQADDRVLADDASMLREPEDCGEGDDAAPAVEPAIVSASRSATA